MALDIDLSRKPYFDDYDVTKNFYRVLYRPAAAVQTRELNQMQNILQDQIDKFGRHIFKEGSVVEGCAFTFDNSYDYAKIKDNFANNFAISNLSEFETRYAINNNGLKALIGNTIRGYESQAPDLNTLYFKYLNSAIYANGTVQSEFSNGENIQIRTSANLIAVDSTLIGNVTIATVVNSAGKGYAFTTTEGIIFKKGFFIRVEPQTIVVTKYNNIPDNISVGFEANEEIITPEIDTSLLDNAAESPNYDAPGAYRLKLVPKLITRTSGSVSSITTFFSLCDFKNGLPISIKNDPQYAALAKDMARRTYETSGDYVVNPFLLSTERKYANNVANSSYLSIVASPGIGYVKGHRVEFINNNTVDLRMGTDYVTVNNQIITANFGYYFNVDQFCGDFNSDNLTQIELHSVAKTAITGGTRLSTTYASSTKIGTAYVLAIAYNSGIPGVDANYKLYVFNVKMLPGRNLVNTKSIIYYTNTLKAVADIILDKDFSNVFIAKIQDSSNELMVYSTQQKAIRPAGFSTTAQYVYKNKASVDFVQTTGIASIALASPVGTGVETFNYGVGELSDTGKNTFIVIPTADGFSSNNTGTVNTQVDSATVSYGDISTTFTSQYNIGDYIQIDNTITRRIINVGNNTHMTVDSVVGGLKTNVTHRKIFPSGVPINFSTPNRIINIQSGTAATLSLNSTITSAFAAVIYFNTLRSATVPISKTFHKSTLIRIQANTNSGTTFGSWCLGIPDVLRLNAVYVDSYFGTYANTNLNATSSFRLDNGQRDSYYDLSYISSTIPIGPNATLLVSVDNLVAAPSQGVGFFSAASYPVDDVNTANTNAIQMHEIPIYTSTIGKVVDLRDSIDFRPYAVNTAISNTSTSGIYTANTIADATLNPSGTLTLYSYGANGAYVPTPDTNFHSTIQYYLPRQDRISLTTGGEIVIFEGIPSLLPSIPVEIPGTMTIGIARIPPYPSLTPTMARQYSRYDYSVQISMLQTKRYTMYDINKLSKRINKLEYYTSLSLIEQATSSLLVRSDSTGQNRFKNGILVDPFKDHTIGNTRDSNYTIAIDPIRAEARPYFRQMSIDMVFDPDASTAVKTGHIITAPFTSNNINHKQPFASKYRNCIEGNIFNYRGTLILDPPGIIEADITQKSLINNDIDLYSNWVNLRKTSGFGTQWGNWTNVGAETSTASTSANQLVSTTDGIQSWQKIITETISQQQTRSGTGQFLTETQHTVAGENYVVDVSIQHFIPAKTIVFKAQGMKPLTKLYVYFDNINVSNRILPLHPVIMPTIITQEGGYVRCGAGYVWIYNGINYQHMFNYDEDLYSTETGDVIGLFSLPANTFTSGDIEFKVTDIENLAQGESAITTEAITTMFCSPLSIQKQRTNNNIRSPVVQISEYTENQNIQRVTSRVESWTTNLQGDIVKPVLCISYGSENEIIGNYTSYYGCNQSTLITNEFEFGEAAGGPAGGPGDLGG